MENPMRVVRKALTFDDVLLVPAHSLVVPRDVQLSTRLTRTIELNLREHMNEIRPLQRVSPADGFVY